MPPGVPLYAYRPDETLRAIVPFYTGRYLTEIRDFKTDVTGREGPLYIVVRDRKKQYEKELLATGRLHVAARYEMGANLALVLLADSYGRDGSAARAGEVSR